MTQEEFYLLADIGIGGNHLASSLVSTLGPGFSERYPPDISADVAREGIAQDRIAFESLSWIVVYDMWVAWAAIMRARPLYQPKQ